MHNPFRSLCLGPPAEAGPPRLPAPLRLALFERHLADFDWESGAPPGPVNYLDLAGLELALCRAATGERFESLRARRALDAAQALVHPSGGCFAFATDNWRRPQAAASPAAQAAMLRGYTIAWQVLARDRDRIAAATLAIGAATLADAITARGVEAAGAADAGLAALVESLAWHHEACWAPASAQAALAAGGALASGLSQRELELRQGRPLALRPILASGRAMLQLFRITGERHWLRRARGAARLIERHFRLDPAGYAGHSHGAQAAHLDAIISTGRFLNLLAFYQPAAGARAAAVHAMRYLAVDAVALARSSNSEILSFDAELAAPPPVLAVSGRSACGQQQCLSARRGWYRQVCWPAAPVPRAPAPAAARGRSLGAAAGA